MPDAKLSIAKTIESIANEKAKKLNGKIKIGVVGLGYVGLPLAIELSKKYFTIRFYIFDMLY